MELDAVHAALRVRHGGIRGRLGSGRDPEAVRQPVDRVAVAHPDRLLGRQAREQAARFDEGDDGRPELLSGELPDLAAERFGHQVEAVADAEDRDAAGPDGRVGVRRALFVDAGGSAGQDDSLRLAGGDLAPRSVERKQLRVHVQLADAPGDELAVLAAEVQNHDRVHVREGGLPANGTGQIRHATLAQRRPPLLSASSLPGLGRWPTPMGVRSGSPASSSPAGRRAAP